MLDLRRSGLTGFVAFALRRSRDERCRALELDFTRIQLRNAFARTELQACQQMWQQAGVKSVAIKGAAFILDHGDDALGIRPMSDLDLLVAPSDYPKAGQLLLSRGFDQPQGRADPCTRAISNEGSFRRRVGGFDVWIDLHRRFGAWPTLRRWRPVIGAGIVAPDGTNTPDRSSTALLVVAHRARAHETGDLRELIDLASAWFGMNDRQFELHVGQLQALGLLEVAQRCWGEIEVYFAPPEAQGRMPRRYLAIDDAEPRVSDYGVWRQNAHARHGFGSLTELMASECIYISARLADRLVFRRGSDRFVRQPRGSALVANPRHYWCWSE